MISLPGGLGGAASAALRPEDPFLFVRGGHDWRWLSFEAAAAGLAGGAGSVAAWDADPAAALLSILADRPRTLPAWAGRLAPSRRRDILVLDRPPAEAGELAVLDWVAATGAALVLEADRDRGAQTVVWARPTVVAGTPADLGALGAALLGWGTVPRLRRRRGPLGRLRAVIQHAGAGEPGPPWSALGVPIVAST